MILPSLNPVNCWKAVKLSPYSVAGDGGRDRMKSGEMEQSAISNQASRKRVEGSTTREGSLNQRHGELPTSAGVLLARLFVGTATFLPDMVKANMVSHGHNRKVLNSVVGLVAVDVVDKLTWVKNSTKMLFHHETVDPDISFCVCERMLGPSDHNVTVVCSDLSRVELVANLNPTGFCGLQDSRDFEAELFGDLGAAEPSLGQFIDLVNGNEIPASLNAESLQVVQNTLFTDTMLSGNLGSRSEFGVIPLKDLLREGYLKFSSSLHKASMMAKGWFSYITMSIISQVKYEMV